MQPGSIGRRPGSAAAPRAGCRCRRPAFWDSRRGRTDRSTTSCRARAGSAAEVAVIKVQRMPAGQDRPIVQQVFPGPIAAKQGERHPALPGQQSQQQQPPRGMIAGGRPGRVASPWRCGSFHEGRMVTPPLRHDKSGWQVAGQMHPPPVTGHPPPRSLDSLPPPVRMALGLHPSGLVWGTRGHEMSEMP